MPIRTLTIVTRLLYDAFELQVGAVNTGGLLMGIPAAVPNVFEMEVTELPYDTLRRELENTDQTDGLQYSTRKEDQ